MEPRAETAVLTLWTGQRFTYEGREFTTVRVATSGSYLKGWATIHTEEGVRIKVRKYSKVMAAPAPTPAR
jgi:hypothetical protein